MPARPPKSPWYQSRRRGTRTSLPSAERPVQGEVGPRRPLQAFVKCDRVPRGKGWAAPGPAVEREVDPRVHSDDAHPALERGGERVAQVAEPGEEHRPAQDPVLDRVRAQAPAGDGDGRRREKPPAPAVRLWLGQEARPDGRVVDVEPEGDPRCIVRQCCRQDVRVEAGQGSAGRNVRPTGSRVLQQASGEIERFSQRRRLPRDTR